MQAESLGDVLQRIKANRVTTQPYDSPPKEQEPAGQACVTCSGRGWYTYDVPVSDPRFAQLVACECQSASASGDRLRRLRAYSNLGNLSRYTFESLDPDRSPAGSAQTFLDALRKSLAFSENPQGWLVLAGPPATGKTHLAAAIVNALIEQGREVLYISVPDLLDDLRAGFNPANPLPYVEIFDRVSDAKVLVLDDLGQHNATEWAREKLHQVLNHRFNGQLPTVFVVEGAVSNLDPVIASRLQDTPEVTITETAIPRVPDSSLWLPPLSLMGRMRFDNFYVFGEDEERRQRQVAIETAEDFARKPQGWLIFTGPTGVGKTHLAVAITQALLPHRDVRYSRVQRMLYRLQATFGDSRNDRSFLSMLSDLSDADVLVLDNLGAEYNTAWNRATLEELIAARHDAQLPTVVTTEYDLSEQTGPVASRLTDVELSQVLSLAASDYRREILRPQ